MRHQLTLVFLVASCQTGSMKIATRTTWWKKLKVGWTRMMMGATLLMEAFVSKQGTA